MYLRLFNLKYLKEFSYLEKILPILIKDNYDLITDEHITYVKSFYTVMYHPSGAKIKMMNTF